MNAMDPNSLSLPQQMPSNMPQAPAQEEKPPVHVDVDKVTFTDGVNHPLEAALLPSTDPVLGQAVAPFVMMGGASIQGTITREDKPGFKEFINAKITSNTTMDQETQQVSGETFTQAAYGNKSAASTISERGTLVTFTGENQALPGMTIAGYVANPGQPQQDINENLNNVVMEGGSLIEGQVTEGLNVMAVSNAFLNGVKEDQIDQIPPEVLPSLLGSYQQGEIGGVGYTRVVAPDGFPNYVIQGNFGDLSETGTIKMFVEGETVTKAVIDRKIGPFIIHEEVSQLKK